MEYKIFWCKTNKYFTEKWLNTKYLHDKSWVFVASCIVTDNAKSKWIKFIKDSVARLEDENAKVYLSWCWTMLNWEIITDFFDRYSELLPYKERIVILWEDPDKEWMIDKIDKARRKTLSTRRYVIIQNWCDSYCTFCTTIQARWGHSFRNAESIIWEIKELEVLWAKEIVLTWTNIWAWGASDTCRPQESRLKDLLSEILNKTKIPRIRISSLWIEFINDDLLEVFKNDRIYAHFHLSIQSWSGKILKSMNRHYSKEELEEVLSKINSLKRNDDIHISIWADLIVWFPWEDDSDFDLTLDLIKKHMIAKVHAFPFSAHNKHDTIPAAFFDWQIDEKIKRDRMKKILEVWESVRSDFLELNNWKKLNLLLERITETSFSWWSENYIALNSSNFRIDQWQDIKVWNIVSWIYIK